MAGHWACMEYRETPGHNAKSCRPLVAPPPLPPALLLQRANELIQAQKVINPLSLSSFAIFGQGVDSSCLLLLGLLTAGEDTIQRSQS
jgi:hypothetical protein